MTPALASRLDDVARETNLNGVVHVAHRGRTVYARASGLSDRAHGIPNELDTQFALASGTKGFTALTAMSLVAEGALPMDADVRGQLREANEIVDRPVTVRQLLAHTSGVGDYLDESSLANVDDYALEVPVHRLATPTDFLTVLRRRPMKFDPGTSFAYSNSGYVLLALLIEAVSGKSYYEAVRERVFVPAGMLGASFPRLDELPGSAAIGYLAEHAGRSNHLHLPVRGGGDGGAYASATDMARFWTALFDGRVLPVGAVEEMVRSSHDGPSTSRRYGLGFWLAGDREAVFLEGSDPGISFRSSFEPATGLVYSVLSNTTSGAWPSVKALEAMLPELVDDLVS